VALGPRPQLQYGAMGGPYREVIAALCLLLGACTPAEWVGRVERLPY